MQSPLTPTSSIPGIKIGLERSSELPFRDEDAITRFELGRNLEPTLAGHFEFELLRGFTTKGHCSWGQDNGPALRV